MQPSPTLSDLAALVRQRREALGLGRRKAATAGGIAAMTWNRVENADAVQRLTYVGIERALRWPQGSIDTYLETGDAPVALPDEPDVTEGEHGPPIGLASYDRVLEELRRRHEDLRTELARRIQQTADADAPPSDNRPHLGEASRAETAESVRARGGETGLPLDGGAEDTGAAQEGQA